MIHVIVVNGSPRAGKDTFIEMLLEDLASQHVPTDTFSSIDPVRALLTAAGFDLSEKTEADRRLLSVVGDAVETHSQWRTNACVDRVKQFASETSNRGAFFLHIREPRNIELVKSLCADAVPDSVFSTIYLDSIRAEKITSNPSDAGVADMIYDHVITNNGTKDDLRAAARNFVIDHIRFHV